MTTTHCLRLGETEVDLLLGDQDELLGLGEVRIAEVRLRSAERPLTVRFDTPDGILYTRLFVETVTGFRIQLRAIGQPWRRSEFADECNQIGLQGQLFTLYTLYFLRPHLYPSSCFYKSANLSLHKM